MNTDELDRWHQWAASDSKLTVKENERKRKKTALFIYRSGPDNKTMGQPISEEF